MSSENEWRDAVLDNQELLKEYLAMARKASGKDKATPPKKNAGNASTADPSSKTPAEILRAAIDSDQPPEDPATVEAFRFDRCYMPEHRRGLLSIYRCLIVTFSVSAEDVQMRIAQGPDTSVALMIATLTQEKMRVLSEGGPDHPTAKLLDDVFDWFVELVHVFFPKDHHLNQKALYDACLAAKADGPPARDDDADYDFLDVVRADIGARAAKGEHIAYMFTNPHRGNRFGLCYFGPPGQPPFEVKTLEESMDGSPNKVVRVSATIGEARAALAEAVAKVRAEAAAKSKGRAKGKARKAQKARTAQEAREALASLTEDVAGLKVEDVD